MRRLKILALLPLAVVVVACDAGSDEDCEGRDGSCSDAWERRCFAQSVEECRDDGDGCLAWVEVEPCEDGASCDDSSGEPSCVGGCSERCETEGAYSCDEARRLVCEPAGEDCLSWAAETNCGEDGRVCEEVEGEASCVDPCAADCFTEDVRRCVGDAIETCESPRAGCLEWHQTDDCSGRDRVCEEGADGPGCVEPCAADCEGVGTVHCSDAGRVETCTAVRDGCIQWVVTDDCPAEGRSCDSSAAPSACGAPLGGDSCSEPLVVPALPFIFSGADLTVEFTDQHRFGHGSCSDLHATVEAVFEVDLAAGDELVVREKGDLDVMLSIQSSCGDAGPCLVLADLGFEESAGISYEAPVDGTFFVILEAFSPAPVVVDVNLHLELREPESCDDGFDNDADDLVDCHDPDCFGVAPCDAVELACDDGGDNDGDGLADCDDSDCEGTVPCSAYLGIYEIIATGDAMDLQGYSILFTPNDSVPGAYEHAVSSGVSSFAVAPGSGDSSVELELSATDFIKHVLATLPPFDFYGERYDSIYIGSNGFLTFGEGRDISFMSAPGFFEQPIIAGLASDLDPSLPSSAGPATITIDELPDRVAVTFDSVPHWYSGDPAGPNSFQMVLHADGSIEIVYVAVSEERAVVGIGNGSGGLIPDEIDFID